MMLLGALNVAAAFLPLPHHVNFHRSLLQTAEYPSIQMVCEPPAKTPHIDELPAWRTEAAQEALADHLTVTEAEEQRVLEALEAAAANATRLQRSKENLRFRLEKAKDALQMAKVRENNAIAAAARATRPHNEQPGTRRGGGVRQLLRSVRGDRQQALVAKQNRDRLGKEAAAAISISNQHRVAVTLAAERLDATSLMADEAIAAVEQLTTMANDATARADEAYRQANAKERVRSAMVDDVLTAGAHMVLLAESLGQGAMSALGLADDDSNDDSNGIWTDRS